MRLLYKSMPRKIPSLRQYRYLSKVLSGKEKKLLMISLAVFLLAAIGLSTRVYLKLTVPVPSFGGSYTEGLVGSPRFINPLLASGNDVDRDISSLVFAGLMRSDATGNLVPDLASQYKLSEDQTEYTFELKDNLIWHDGEPLTIDDVIFTIKTIQDPTFKSPLRVSFSGVRVDKLDRRTIKLTLPESFPSFLSALTVGIIPEHIWYSIPPAQAHLAEINIKPIGAGPFRFKSFTKDNNGIIHNLTLTRNKNYHGNTSYIENLTFKFYPDIESAIESLKNKNVEGVGFLPLEYRTDLESNSQVVLHQLDLPHHRALFFNPDNNDVLKDKNVRRALSYAVDRERIVQEALLGNGRTITAPLLPGTKLTLSPELTYNYDPDKALSILEENNWTLTEEAVVRTKNDVELAVILTTVDQPENIKAASIIKENWEALNIATHIQIISKQKIKNDIIEPRDYQVLLFGQITTSSQDVYAFWHSSQTRHPGNNLSLFANKDIDATLEEFRNNTDPQKHDELYEKFITKLTTETFAIFLYTPTYIYPVSKNIKGVDRLQNVSLPSDRFNTIDQWYIKTDREWK